MWACFDLNDVTYHECFPSQSSFKWTFKIFSVLVVALSVQALPSNPAGRVRFPTGSEILISILELGVSFVSVLTWLALRLCWHTFRETRLCVCCSSYRHLTQGIWVVSSTLAEGKYQSNKRTFLLSHLRKKLEVKRPTWKVIIFSIVLYGWKLISHWGRGA